MSVQVNAYRSLLLKKSADHGWPADWTFLIYIKKRCWWLASRSNVNCEYDLLA
jgi:hypothetical protein